MYIVDKFAAVKILIIAVFLLLLSKTPVSAQTASLSANLSAYWSMDEAAWVNDCTTGTVIDDSGNNNTGKACPATTGPVSGTAGKFGNGGTFDGVNDFVNAGSGTSIDDLTVGDFTVSGWLLVNTTSGYQNVINKDNNGDNGWAIYLQVHPTTSALRFRLGRSTTDLLYQTTTTAITNGTWTHFTTVYQNNSGNPTVKLYINGVELTPVSSSAGAGTIDSDAARSLEIGRQNSAFASLFNGMMDDIRIYTVALTAGDVTNLYQLDLSPTPPSIVLGSVSPDPGNDNTPSLTGTATDIDSTVAAISYQVDNTGSWNNCTADDGTFDSATETFTCTVGTALPDGTHILSVRAQDAVGDLTNSNNYQFDSFTIDTTSPTTPGVPSATSPTNSGSQSWSWSAATDIASGVAEYAWRIVDSLDSAVSSGTTSVASLTTNLSQGIYNLFIKAIDSVYNESTEISGSITVDTDAPLITLAGFTPDPTNNVTPTYTGTATDNLTALSDIQYQVDSGSWTSCSADDGELMKLVKNSVVQ